VSPYYKKEIFNKLQRLSQGNRSVKKYVQEMEVTLMQAQGDSRMWWKCTVTSR